MKILESVLIDWTDETDEPPGWLSELGILVINTPDGITDSVSEHAIALMMTAVRPVIYPIVPGQIQNK